MSHTHNKPFWNKYTQSCAISHSRLRSGKNKDGISYVIFLPCKHGFYRKPLLEWITKCPVFPPTCPVCRSVFKITDKF